MSLKSVLAIGAHPDDIEIGCGGTLTALRKLNYDLVFVVVTDGEEGKITEAPARLAAQRREEALASASVLGAGAVAFLGLEDGLTSFTKQSKVRLAQLIREHRPEIVFTHSACDAFSDHRLVHRLSLDAIAIASGPWFPAAGATPHAVSQVYGYEVWHSINKPILVFDISDHIQTKIEALRRHTSQTQNINYVQAVEGLALYRGAMALNCHHAEAFEVLRTQRINELGSKSLRTTPSSMLE